MDGISGAKSVSRPEFGGHLGSRQIDRSQFEQSEQANQRACLFGSPLSTWTGEKLREQDDRTNSYGSTIDAWTGEQRGNPFSKRMGWLGCINQYVSVESVQRSVFPTRTATPLNMCDEFLDTFGT